MKNRNISAFKMTKATFVGLGGAVTGAAVKVADNLASIDSIQIIKSKQFTVAGGADDISVAADVVTLEGSLDNVNWFNITADGTAGASTYIMGGTNRRLQTMPVHFLWIRGNGVSTIGGGVQWEIDVHVKEWAS